MTSSSIKLLLLLVFLPIGLNAQKTISFPDGTFHDTDDEDFLARNLPSKYYNELWTYHLNLDNGVQVVYTFSINDFGSFKSRVTGGKLMVHWTDGKSYVVNKEYSPEQFINEADSNYIRLHENRTYWAKGSFDDEHTLNFRTTKDGTQYFLNVTLFDIAQGKTIGDGTYKIGDNEIGISLLIPHAKVKGRLAINGDTLNVSGTAYMDHVYQNNLSTKIMDRSYRIKTGDDENGMFFHYIILQESGSHIPIGYGVGFRNGFEYLLTPQAINRIHRKGNLDIEVMIKSHQADSLNIKVINHMDTYSMLNELSRMQKFVAKRVIGGELIEMFGSVTINETKPGYFYYMVAD